MKEILIDTLPIIPTRLWGNVSLFSLSDGLKLIMYCKKNNIAVLGIEGFIIKNGKIIPDMNCIVDFSDMYKNYRKNFIKNSIEISKLFIESINNKDIYLEFLLVGY